MGTPFVCSTPEGVSLIEARCVARLPDEQRRFLNPIPHRWIMKTSGRDRSTLQKGGRRDLLCCSKLPLMLRALAGEPVERPPVWMMRQAGRYMKVIPDPSSLTSLLNRVVRCIKISVSSIRPSENDQRLWNWLFDA